MRWNGCWNRTILRFATGPSQNFWTRAEWRKRKKQKDRQRFVNKDMELDSFPITWRTNVWEILYGLAKMGYGKDERLTDAWKVLESRKDQGGRYLLGWTPAQSPWKAGKRGEPNKWITLYCLLAEKYCERGN